MKADGICVYTVKDDLYKVGLTTAQTPFGHIVPAYDMERTICDVLRYRNELEMQIFQDALKQYARRKDKKLRSLMQYAALFRRERQIVVNMVLGFVCVNLRYLRENKSS